MNEAAGYQEGLALLQKPETQRPTGFVCSSVGQALGLRRAALEQGLVIGRDIAVIAHDDRLHEIKAENFDPPLSATQSSIGAAGKRVVELCVGMLRNGAEERPAEVWPVDLVVRQSTMRAPGL
jgi:LacI family transcriptional regulator